ncbi:winged helix-turn-helix transcriptional regulator [Flammeovirga agarivorans]|uniref:Winged helix-turn-helix transcriptional regulator n=1 Tax=Flammeovirga agarivorans TaxID=2726742 RepID=A0A7X8SQU5_9BACT|nr:helix-turn-helix domain-containing protein [Flammeovirga agarivorans]NLR94690.1 winged helix-turn-helix transcriptional regulator [Flammeovirga agarivorans]
MKYKVDGKEYPCCTSLTMKYIGGKWKSVILIHLKDTTLRYSELRKMIPTVSERTLSLQLKQLEEDGLIKREVIPTEKPPLKVEYSMTDFGRTLTPLLEMISSWGEEAVKWDSKVEEIEE